MHWRLSVVCCLLLSSGSSLFAQAVNIGAQGTSQVPGAVGIINKTYTLGSSPLSFTLLEATYRADQVRLGDHVYYAVAGEKLLVLRYMIQNPQKVDLKVFWSAFSFLAVDSTDTSCEGFKAAAQLEVGPDKVVTQEKLDILLKPGQKIQALTVVPVAAVGEVPKLIVERGAPPVLRYDLRGKVGRLPEPYADPADETGATLRDEVPAVFKTPYATGIFQTSIDDLTFTTEPVAGSKPPAKQYALVTVTVTNMNTDEESMFYSDFIPKLVLEGDEEARYVKTVFHSTRDEKLNGAKVAPGKTATVRWCFDCPVDGAAKTLIVQEKASSKKDGRRFVYTLTPPPATPAE